MLVGSSWEFPVPIWSVVAVRTAVFVTGPNTVLDTLPVTTMALVVAPTGRAAFKVQLTPEAGGWQVQPVPLTAVRVIAVGSASVTCTVPVVRPGPVLDPLAPMFFTVME